MQVNECIHVPIDVSLLHTLITAVTNVTVLPSSHPSSRESHKVHRIFKVIASCILCVYPSPCPGPYPSPSISTHSLSRCRHTQNRSNLCFHCPPGYLSPWPCRAPQCASCLALPTGDLRGCNHRPNRLAREWNRSSRHAAGSLDPCRGTLFGLWLSRLFVSENVQICKEKGGGRKGK